MQSLYGRLFKYRERPYRRPLEDFLSECLADLFNRLPPGEKAAFIERNFLPSVVKPRWASLVSTGVDIRMETQWPIPDGRLDIAILIENEPAFVIENKVSAPIGRRPNDIDQLSAYGMWLKLKSESSVCKLAVVCLLTHATNPPETFAEGRTDLYGSIPKVVRWSQIADNLRTLAQSSKLPLDIRTISNELFSFLLEQNMTSEATRLEDFAAAIIYVRAGSRMSQTFGEVFDHLSELGGIFSKGAVIADSALEFDSDRSLIQGWKYLSAAPLKTAYFGYGIALQPRRSLSNDHLPIEDSIFLCLGVETKREIRILEEQSKLLSGAWQHLSFPSNSIAIAFKPLNAVLVRPEEFAKAMIGWIDEVLPEVAELVNRMQKQSQL
jgi:hypothetical protein